MKRIVILFVSVGLIASILFSSSIKSWKYLSYEFNKAEITALFCINKDKPELHCEGSCHLKKELKKESKKDVPFTFTHRLEIQFFYQKKSALNFNQYSNYSIPFKNYQATITEEYFSSLFRPPKFS